jgi:lipopolysaccharide export system protein LptA
MAQRLKNKTSRHKWQWICFFCLFSLFLSEQKIYSSNPSSLPAKEASAGKQKEKKKPAAKSAKPTAPQQSMEHRYAQSGLMKAPQIKVPAKKKTPGKKIYLEHSDTLSFDQFLHPDYQIFSGNVRFRHEGAKLFCDLAHYYQKTNSLYAFGNVHMEQGDTLFLYGAWLFYDGATKLVQIREKVRLENRNVTLFTDSLNYDRITNVGYFFDGGLLVDETNELSSEYGQYSSATKIADFRNDVKLVHPKFVLSNNDLTYNTSNHVADIHVPTTILSDRGYVKSSKGWYNSQNDQSKLFDRSSVISNRRYLTGDTLYYDQKKGIGEAFGNVLMEDTTQQITMRGGYGYSEDATGYALMSRRAVMIEHSGKDTLFMHADSLISCQDSIYKNIYAYHGVRFYRTDFQGVCDSLFYTTRDSVLSLYEKPVLWSNQQQMTGNFMQMHTRNSKPLMLHIQKSAMVISQEGDSLYDQTSGKDLKAFFDSSQVVKVEIRGNAETVYLPRDGDNVIIGLNHLEGSSLDLYRRDEKVKKIIVWPEPQGKFYPLDKLDPEAQFLKNFAWYSDVRPISPEDIFREVKIKEIPKSSDTSKAFDTKKASDAKRTKPGNAQGGPPKGRPEGKK